MLKECSSCGLWHSPTRDCDVEELRRQYEQVCETFAHDFIDPASHHSNDWLNKHNDSHAEKCLKCGLNIRHPVHTIKYRFR